MYSWKECGLIDEEKVHLHIFIAYDLEYNGAKPADFTQIGSDVAEKVDGITFVNASFIAGEREALLKGNIISKQEASLFFSSGYAAMRNAVLYAAVKNHMDYLLFLDDDEYPLAVTKTRDVPIWSGQHVLACHLRHIKDANITNGHHCGYVSPIPHITFDSNLTESNFKLFIEALSNDILNWDNVLHTIDRGGFSYADTSVLTASDPIEVPLVNSCKFISGANLCLNLTDVDSVNPFYNPPGARGEDTFLSTCLHDKTVLRVPCYTFHDGFSTYNHLLNGVLPIKLKSISASSPKAVTRFYNACVGWIRYKPLLLYITQRKHYEERIREIRRKLAASAPRLCAYFKRNDFNYILDELEMYHQSVEKHYRQFVRNQETWSKICPRLANN